MNQPIGLGRNIVRKFNLYEVYVFAQRMAPLQPIEADGKISDFVFELYEADESLKAMIGVDSPLLETGRRAAERLRDAITVIYAGQFAKLLEIPKDTEFGWLNGPKIKNALKDLESVLSNDMPGISSYLVSQKGIYRTDDLIEHADRYFPEEIRIAIPQQASKDLIEAGKCLAYEVSTACAFHLWRAVETVMGEYYEKIAGKTFAADGIDKNWGAYVKALNSKAADNKITQFLDHIRSEYRNPQTHPEAMLEVSEALGLFGVAMSAIQQMILAIQKP
jgi:hypothetical protein